MGQYFGGEVSFGCGGGWNELVSHVICDLVVERIGIVGEREGDGLEQVP